MINLMESSPTDAMDSSNTNATDQNEVEASAQVDSERDKINKVWTLEYDIALLEEVRNYNAHIPRPKEKTTQFENVTQALINCGTPFKNPGTILVRFSHLKRSHASKMAKQQSTSGVENFSDEDPLADLMEDLLQEIKDNDAMKDDAKQEKQSKEEQLAVGGKAFRDKCAMQILAGNANPIGGQVIALSDLRASPTMSEASTNASDSGSKKKTSQNLFFSDSELIENEKKKLELEQKRFEMEVELKRDEMKEAAERARMEMEQRMQIHRDMMTIQKQEIEAKVQSIQFQIAQHNDDMKMRFLELEQKNKN
jgi:hypothetical protein